MTRLATVLESSFEKVRRLSRRVLPFLTSAGAYSLLLWFILMGTLLVAQPPRHIPATLTILAQVLVVAGLGAAFSTVASLGIRYLQQKVRLPRVPLYGLGVLWVLMLSVACWQMIRLAFRFSGSGETPLAQRMSAQAGISILTVAALFCFAYATREPVAEFLRRSAVWQRVRPQRQTAAQRWQAFRLCPKALGMGNPLDVFEVLEDFQAVKEAYGQSGRYGDKLLEFFQHKHAVSSDPRYHSPMPLPVAFEFLRREIELSRAVDECPVTVKTPPVDSFPAEGTIEPALLCSAAVFAFRYLHYHQRSNAVLAFGFTDSPMPCVEIQTDSRNKDLWFALQDQSIAQQAKRRLVDVVNRLAARGHVFETAHDSDNHLVFRLFLFCPSDKETLWADVEHTLGKAAQVCSYTDRSAGTNRVYTNGDLIHKVQLLGQQSPKPLTLAEEYNTICRLQGIEGVPRAPAYEEYGGFALLSYARFEGRPIDEYLAQRDFDHSAWVHCLAELTAVLRRIHERGVVHRDLRPGNVLVSGDGRVCLIDFDQAVAGTRGAESVDTRGESAGVIPPCVSLTQLIDLLGLGHDYAAMTEELRAAWDLAAQSDASSPGRNIAYYRFQFADTELPGERDWFVRWDTMIGSLREVLPGARVLDLGCNMGLLAAHCKLYGAEQVTAVDMHDDILAAGRALARAMGVSIDFVKGDLNNREFVDSLLGQQYDLVIALSVIHWLESPAEALRLLGAAPMVLFEGHDPPSAGFDLLRRLGFEYVKLIGYSERLRGLFLCSRQAKPRGG